MAYQEENFISDVRRKVARVLCISYESTCEIDTETKADAALAALYEWEETKRQHCNINTKEA